MPPYESIITEVSLLELPHPAAWSADQQAWQGGQQLPQCTQHSSLICTHCYTYTLQIIDIYKYEYGHPPSQYRALAGMVAGSL